MSQDQTLLLVDDNEDNLYTLSLRLKREGYSHIVTAGNGREALERLQAQPFDLVLLDIMMPELNGYEVLAAMKSAARLRHIPVIMISAVDEIDSVTRCIEQGAEDYLSKPFNPVLLRARVGACLEKKRLRDQEVQHVEELAELNRTLEQRVRDQVAQLDNLGRLKRFFSPQLAEMIVAGGADDPLKTHRREVTVVFLDLRGFTAFAQGYATIGAIGFEGRRDYGAIGTVSNLAARLCGEATDGQILVSSRVATAAEGFADAPEVGSLTLKGLSRPVRTFNIGELQSALTMA